MKKYLIALSAVVFLSIGLSFFYFFGNNGKFFLSSEASSSGQKQISSALQAKSFQGALADSFEQIGRISSATTQKITDSIPDYFTNKSSAEKQKNTSATAKKSMSFGSAFSFAVIGDTQNFNFENENGYFQQTVKSIRKINPAFVVALGDLQGKCSGGKNCKRDYEYWENIMGDLAPKTYAVQGNHDRIGDSRADEAWRSKFEFPKNGPEGLSEITYFFDFGNSRFIVLASDNPEIHLVDTSQRAWLDQNLATNKKGNVFVFFHEPAYPVYQKSGESLDNHPSERDALWQIFDKYNVTAVFSGHEHIATRRLIDSKIFPDAKNSIYQFVFGNTDSFDHTLPDPGVAEFSDQGQGRFGIVKVNGKEITVETHGPDGDLINTFTFSK
jgi:hypothetical protein